MIQAARATGNGFGSERVWSRPFKSREALPRLPDLVLIRLATIRLY